MGFKLLIVDDVPENITALTKALGGQDITFFKATSGEEALKILSENHEFGLALLDVQMPKMDGFDLAKLMRSEEKTKNIPIIFITAQNRNLAFEFKGYELGAIDILFKPLNMAILKSKVSVFKRLAFKRHALSEKVEELDRAKKALELSEKKAIESDQIKSSFLANMSHEIRTPMTALIGFAELLRPQLKNNEVGIKYLETILKNAHDLVILINEILDLSKLEAGQLAIDMIAVHPFELIRDTIELLNPLAKKNNVEVSLTFCNDLRIPGFTDPYRFKQVLNNVVGNAIKFSKGGSVKIVVSSQVDNNVDQNAVIKVSVQDNGTGIDSSGRELLFKPFSQVLTEHSEYSEGTGLGLSLSKKIATLLGGNLYLQESQKGVGSIFVFECPVKLDFSIKKQDKSRDALVLGPNILKHFNILVVDDNPDNQMLLSTVLEDFGAKVLGEHDGYSAIERLNTNNFDIVLMDYKMPKLDGLETTRKLRLHGNRTPIILLTANAMKGEKENALQAGADAYVSKPIQWELLVGEILRLSKNHSSQRKKIV